MRKKTDPVIAPNLGERFNRAVWYLSFFSVALVVALSLVFIKHQLDIAHEILGISYQTLLCSILALYVVIVFLPYKSNDWWSNLKIDLIKLKDQFTQNFVIVLSSLSSRIANCFLSVDSSTRNYCSHVVCLPKRIHNIFDTYTVIIIAAIGRINKNSLGELFNRLFYAFSFMRDQIYGHHKESVYRQLSVFVEILENRNKNKYNKSSLSDSFNFRIKDSSEITYPTSDNFNLVKYTMKHNPNTLNIIALKFMEKFLNFNSDKRTFQLKFAKFYYSYSNYIRIRKTAKFYYCRKCYPSTDWIENDFPRNLEIFPVFPKLL